MPAPATHIRLYRPQDRAAVRQICCETADMGKPVERFFADREVFADLWTRYYTDFEPQHLWVVESANRVCGYLSASCQPQRFRRVWRWYLAPVIFAKALSRGVFFRESTWKLLWRNRGLAKPQCAEPSREDYSAHFHINVDQQVRGQGVGISLIQTFLEQARAGHAKGIMVATRADNQPIAALLQKFGFQLLYEWKTFIVPGQPEPRKKVWGLHL